MKVVVMMVVREVVNTCIYIVQDDGAKVDGEDDDEAVGGEGGKESGSG